MSASSAMVDSFLVGNSLDGLPFAQVAYGAVLGVVHSQCSGHSAKALVGAVVRAALSLEMGIPEQDAANSINALGAFVGSRWPFLLRRGFGGVIGKSQSSNHRVHHKNKSRTEGAPQKKEWIGGCSKKKKAR
jgi:hypothetical protein